MRLSGPQLEKLQQAILQAFDYADLDRHVRAALDVELENFSLPGSAAQGVYELLHETEKHGWTIKLLKALADKRAENSAFQEQVFEAITVLETLDAANGGVPASNAGGTGTTGGRAKWPGRIYQALPGAMAGVIILGFATLIDDVWLTVNEWIFAPQQKCVETISTFVNQGSVDLQKLNRNQLRDRLAGANRIQKHAEPCRDAPEVVVNLGYLDDQIQALQGWIDARAIEAAIESFKLTHADADKVEAAEIDEVLVKANTLRTRLAATKENSPEAHDLVAAIVGHDLRKFTNSLVKKRDKDALKLAADPDDVPPDADARTGVVSVLQLQNALRVSRAVGKVYAKRADGSPLGRGTGFRIAQDLILTADHILGSADIASSLFAIPVTNSTAENGGPILSNFEFEPDRCLVSNRDLGFALVAIAAESQEGLTLGAGEFVGLRALSVPLIGDTSSVVHYGGDDDDPAVPNISLRDGQVQKVNPDKLQYSNSTGFGSSGAPVLDSQWRAIALHLAKVPARDSQGQMLVPVKWIGKEGARIDRIANWLKTARDNNDADVTACSGIDELLALSGLDTLAVPNTPTARNTVYFDETANSRAVARYYKSVQPTDESGALLAKLLQQSHKPVGSYREALLEYLYPWVDLRPDGRLYGIYSQQPLGVASSGSLPFNTEQVVPQSWYDSSEPMKSDLHNMFALDAGCNSFRGANKFGIVEEGTVLEDCGRRGDAKFEPKTGKGTAARAFLYFMLRNPQVFAAGSRGQLSTEDIDVLLKWHNRFPPDIYEKHRNAAIFEIQGNRNPFIDKPDWANQINFTDSLRLSLKNG